MNTKNCFSCFLMNTLICRFYVSVTSELSSSNIFNLRYILIVQMVWKLTKMYQKSTNFQQVSVLFFWFYSSFHALILGNRCAKYHFHLEYYRPNCLICSDPLVVVAVNICTVSSVHGSLVELF